MEIAISWIDDHEHHSETRVIWDYEEIIWRINPDRKPTDEELSACPKVFTCYADGEKHPLRELGGRYHDKWFCSGCIPYVDEWTAGTMVWWEERRKKPNHGKQKASSRDAKLERLQSLSNLVSWAKINGYPLRK